jgi:hypothetical protein
MQGYQAAKNAPTNKAAKEAPTKKTAAKKKLRGQIHPQRQVLIEYPAQRGVHRMRGCEVRSASGVERVLGGRQRVVDGVEPFWWAACGC